MPAWRVSGSRKNSRGANPAKKRKVSLDRGGPLAFDALKFFCLAGFFGLCGVPWYIYYAFFGTTS